MNKPQLITISYLKLPFYSILSKFKQHLRHNEKATIYFFNYTIIF